MVPGLKRECPQGPGRSQKGLVAQRSQDSSKGDVAPLLQLILAIGLQAQCVGPHNIYLGRRSWGYRDFMFIWGCWRLKGLGLPHFIPWHCSRDAILSEFLIFHEKNGSPDFYLKYQDFKIWSIN